jgi:hypothetical protein
VRDDQRPHARESIPEKGESGFDQSLRALGEELKENPRLSEMPAEVVARQLALGGHMEGEPASPLVAQGLEAEEQSFQNDELSSEEANPT